jgi:transposase
VCQAVAEDLTLPGFFWTPQLARDGQGCPPWHIAKRRSFTPEQKADDVRLVRQVGSVGKGAKDLDLTETTLREWVRQATEGAGPATAPALNAAERKELD